MERNKEKTNTLNLQNRVFIRNSKKIYNSLRNLDIKVFVGNIDGSLSLQDKKCLSLYLSALNGDNFFNSAMTKLNYKRFPDFLTAIDTNVYHFEDELDEFLNYFINEEFFETLLLYLIDYPIIKQINAYEGYSINVMKQVVYDYLNNNAMEKISNEKNVQKVLTK